MAGKTDKEMILQIYWYFYNTMRDQLQVLRNEIETIIHEDCPKEKTNKIINTLVQVDHVVLQTTTVVAQHMLPISEIENVDF